MKLRLRAIVDTFYLDAEMVNANVGLLSKRCLRDRGLDLKLAVGGKQIQANLPNLEALRDVVATERIDCVAFAPMSRAHDADDSDSVAMRIAMDVIGDFAEDANVSTLLAHHTPKGAKAGTAEALKGSVDIINAARAAFTMFPADEDDIRHYALPKQQRHLFLRFDDVKANYSLLDSKPRWLKRHSFTPLGASYSVGTLIPADLEAERQTQAMQLAIDLCIVYDLEAAASLPIGEAVKRLLRLPHYESVEKNELVQKMEALLRGGVAVNGRRVYLVYDGAAKRAQDRTLVGVD